MLMAQLVMLELPLKTDDATGRTERSRSRGIVTEVVSNTAGGEVRVTFP